MKLKGKKLRPVLITAAVVAVILLAIFYLPKAQSNSINGYWDEATQQCWYDSTHKPGIAYPIAELLQSSKTCCFDRDGYQVDCADSTKRLGPHKTLSVYQGTGMASSTRGIFTVSHVITISNTGAFDLDKAWIDTATWTCSTPTTCPSAAISTINTAYSGIIGNANGKAIPKGTGVTFNPGTISLSSLQGPAGTPANYNLNMVVKVSAYTGQLTDQQTATGYMTVEEEKIAFNVNLKFG